MIKGKLKLSIRVLVGCCLFVLLLGCANLSSDSDSVDKPLPLGLYKVVERECQYPSGVPEDCSQTRYVELIKGVFYGINKDETAFVAWLAENPTRPHGYVARDLRLGFFLDAHKFVVKDDAFSKEWFVIRDGTISDYYFIRHNRQYPQRNMAGKTHLVLRQVPRGAKMNNLLPYPEEVVE